MPRCAIFSIAAHGKSRHGDLVGQAMIPVALMEREHQSSTPALVGSESGSGNGGDLLGEALHRGFLANTNPSGL